MSSKERESTGEGMAKVIRHPSWRRAPAEEPGGAAEAKTPSEKPPAAPAETSDPDEVWDGTAGR